MRARSNYSHSDRLESRDRVGRGALLVAIGALHVLAILWLAAQHSPAPRPNEATVSLIEISKSTGAAVAPVPLKPPAAELKPLEPVIIAPSPVPGIMAAPAEASASEVGGGAALGGGCTLSQAVGDAILADTAAMAELDALPAEARTKADAVMLWDGRWEGRGLGSSTVQRVAPPAGTASTSAVRSVVEQVVRGALPECTKAPVSGPQFIILPGPLRNTIIVIGSGKWRWADLLAPDEHCLPDHGPACQSTTADPTITRQTNN